MKNYLFAPFKDDDDKMMTWNSCKSGIDQGIMIFLGRLESTYDVIISELRSKNAGAIADERVIERLHAENKELKAENDALKEQVEDLMIDLAQAKKLRDKFGVERDDNRKNIDILKAEIKTLKADYDSDIKASYDLDDTHGEIIKRLEAEKDALLVANGELLQSNLKLREDNGVLDGFKEGSNQSI